MNIIWLKYAVEVEKCGSINKAAENLYIGQPNLSRAIHELEDSLGIKIFDRTSKGMNITAQGEEFLGYAKKILNQIDQVENFYKEGNIHKQKLAVSVPRASYIAEAFVKFELSLDKNQPCEIFYKETNSLRAIKNMLEEDYNLGIIRYATKNDKYFREMLDTKGLEYETISDFNYVLIMSENSPLAKLPEIKYSDLTDKIEIAHADPYVPSLSLSVIRKEELPDNINKRVFVFERASQFELLSSDINTFMWVSPLTEGMASKYNLVQRHCEENKKMYRDVLIYRKNYRLTKLDKMFIEELYNARDKYFK